MVMLLPSILQFDVFDDLSEKQILNVPLNCEADSTKCYTAAFNSGP
jgi:hypothetical protein